MSSLSSDSDPLYPRVSICQPVEEALRQQVEQERLLNQVTTQIRQSLELPVILETAVEQVRRFLRVDRLLIYQFELPASTPVATDAERGCVTYEARASAAIPSALELTEESIDLRHVPNCRDKYAQGETIAIADVEIAYSASPCLLELLERYQVRAKLIAPIVVQDRLWGLLIAHQCLEPRQWQEREQIFLKQIAEHLAVAIYQAQLYAQLQQQKTTLEQRVIERTQELRDTLQAAQAANRAKSEFLAAMSHELRTPLTCVIGMSATLLRWSFGRQGAQVVPLHKQRRYLKTIQESGEHLLELIDDILDLSQVESGKAILNISEFSLARLLHQTLQTLEEKAYFQKVTLEVDSRIRPEHDRFCADRRRVKQILFNLLGNAVKFTPEGGKVTLRAWREENLAIFQVEDTGIGIAQEHFPLLFQKFQQLETPYHRNYEGTGLGLALTKQFVELHGGRIGVESAIGEGSTFTVWLPNQSKPSASPTKSTANARTRSPSRGSVVLVCDREEMATLICELLTAADYQVVWLVDGATALGQIELLQPKVVLIDWQLPGLDGTELTYSLHNSPEAGLIKVLAITTANLSEEQEAQMKAIVDDYLFKPVEPTPLLHKVMALVND
jgi:two-component system sensor histidine kinase/response regulator